MSKPREFWITVGKWFEFDKLPDSYKQVGAFPCIHVREVIEISEAEINEAADELANYSCRRSAEDGIRWAIARLGGK